MGVYPVAVFVFGRGLHHIAGSAFVGGRGLHHIAGSAFVGGRGLHPIAGSAFVGGRGLHPIAGSAFVGGRGLHRLPNILSPLRGSPSTITLLASANFPDVSRRAELNRPFRATPAHHPNSQFSILNFQFSIFNESIDPPMEKWNWLPPYWVEPSTSSKP